MMSEKLDDSNGIAPVHACDNLPASEFRAWLRQRHEDESKKALGERALDAFEALANRESVSADEIAPLVEAACSRYFVAWDIGMHFLCRLAARQATARDAMARLFESKSADIRKRVIDAIHDRLPKEFCIDLVRRGFSDKSKRVRQAAAHKCRCFLLAELLAELGHHANTETDKDTKFGFEYAIGIIRDGYFVYAQPDGSQAFVVRISDGYPARLLYPGPGWCTQADLDERGPKAVAEEIRRTSGQTERPFRWNCTEVAK